MVEKFEAAGQWLFRWRSYLPLALLAVVIPAMHGFSYPDGSQDYDRLWEVFCLFVSCIGLFIRAYTIGHAPRGTSGRNVANQLAERLNQTGIYSMCRNPLYLGNFFMILGVVSFVREIGRASCRERVWVSVSDASRERHAATPCSTPPHPPHARA